MSSPHRLLLASAGTGKTWQLTTHYLNLVLRGVEPERILATTFTRKAAGEILGRVLERLAEAAQDEAAAQTLGADVGLPDLNARACRTRLVELAQSLHHFRIQTLDAWFAHIGRLFASELGLPPDWRIGDEAEERRVRSDALVDSLSDGDDGEWLVLLRALASGEGDLRVHAALLDHVRTGSNVADGIPDEAWNVPTVPADVADGVFGEALNALELAELPTNAKGKVNGHWDRARLGLLEVLRAGDWIKLLKNGFVRYGPDPLPYHKLEYSDELLAIFDVVMRRGRHHVMAGVAGRNAALRDLLARFRTVHARHQWDSRTLRFDDVGAALARSSDDGFELNPIELAFRLDARIGHLLLDEFQDTAPVQWTVLRPLVENITAEGDGERTFFCVGDEKQSIYGFRGGEPRLLASLPEELGLVGEPQDMSRRSATVVLETINQLFAKVDRLSTLGESEPLRLAAEEFAGRFREHTAFDATAPGAAYLWQAPQPADPSDGDDGDTDGDIDEDGRKLRDAEQALAFAVDHVAALHAATPHARIGVLFRRNTLLAKFVRALELRGVPASGEGGSSLTDAAPVLAAIAALHLADHPSDSAAAHHVATSCLADVIGMPPKPDRAQAEAVARQVRRRYAEEGPGALLASWATAVRASQDAYGLQRFEQVIDLAYEVAPSVMGRPSALVRRIRDAKHEDLRPGAVRAMTIHKSKGLEFDAVVLPELSFELLGMAPNLLIARPRSTEPVTAVSTYVAKEILAHSEELTALNTETRRREAVDDLCVLYVALTRARHRIDMILPAKMPKLCYGQLLLDAFATEDPDDSGLLWKHPDSADAWMPSASQSDEVPEPRPEPELKLGAGRGRRHRARRTASGQKGSRVRRGADLLQRYGQDARRRGTLVHRLMAQVEWLEAFDLGDDVLLAHLRDEDPDASAGAQNEALTLFRDALAMPGIQDLLTRGDSSAEDLEVRNERNFHESVAGEDGDALWTGAMDRVVIRRKDGRIVSADIIDHKTDDPAGGLEPLIEQYRSQMESYRAVLAHQLDLDPDCIRCRLAFLRVGEVRDV
tara:strand:- start:2954 stop:6121 length:3168 start_codon:yes stop_codon:yes gene_type:complete